MRYFLLFFLFVSCAGVKPIKKNDLDSKLKALLGKEVYVPVGVNSIATLEKTYRLNKVSINLEASQNFNNCKKAKVVEFFKQGAGGYTRALLIQDNKYFAIGGRGFLLDADDLYLKYPEADKSFKEVPAMQVTRDKWLCTGVSWVGMSEAELFYLKGKPTKVNTSVNSNSIQKQLIYRGSVDTYFYSKNGIVTSWQN